MRAATDVWSPADIPDQTGRTVVVTGTTVGGLGHATALELAGHGARVVLAGRTQERLDEAEKAVRDEVPHAELETLVVDLADQGSIRRAADQAAALGPIDVLVNNAGVMGTAHHRTVDGLELQMATNHFGPFLLTGLLLPQLAASNAATVVAVSSLMHRVARRAPLDDPRQPGGHYSKWPVYAQSQAGQPALHLRARPPGPPGRAAGQGARGAPRLLRHPPGRQRALRALERRPGLDPRRGDPGGRPARPDGRLADADGGHRRPAGIDVLRAERAGRDARCAGGRGQREGRARRVRPAPAVGAQRARDGDPLPLRDGSVGVVGRVVRHETVVETRSSTTVS